MNHLDLAKAKRTGLATVTSRLLDALPSRDRPRRPTRLVGQSVSMRFSAR